ncbi:Ras association (RalGDS AF-6) domain (N-terminal) member [Mactra antiquata]
MTDVQNHKDGDIPLKVDGVTRYVKGVTKYTTCGDVIKMVLKKTGIKKEYRHLFAIYEVSRDTEKALPCKTRILKEFKAWRGQQKWFVLRKSDPLTPLTLTEKTKKWNLKKKSKREPEVRERRNLFSEAFSSSLNKMKNQGQDKSVSDCVMKPASSLTSSSESDSSMDEFLSNLDHSKMAGLLNFFVAMTNKTQQNQNHNKRDSASSLESNASSSDSRATQTINRRSHRRIRRAKRRSTKNLVATASDLHPSKMHAVKRVNFGFIDAEPRAYDNLYSRSDLQTTEDDFDCRLRSIPRFPKAHKVRRSLVPSYDPECYKYEIQESRISERKHSLGSFENTREVAFPTWYTTRCSLPGLKYGKVNDNPALLTDSGHEGDSDRSLDNDDLYPDKLNLCRIEEFDHVSMTSQDFDDVTTEPYEKFARNLVNYSITDDEFENEMNDIFNTDKQTVGNLDTNREINSYINHGMEVGAMDSTFEEIRASLSIPSQKDSNIVVKPYTRCVVCESPGLNKEMVTYIQSVFQPVCDNEDDEMNSFMKSMILDDTTDEGLSSIGESDPDIDGLKS